MSTGEVKDREKEETDGVRLEPLPFRARLRGEDSAAQDPRVLYLINLLAREGAPPPHELLLEAAQHRYEVLPLLVMGRMRMALSGSLVSSERREEQMRVARELLTNALGGAEEEGIVWTPLLDRVLSERKLWSSYTSRDDEVRVLMEKVESRFSALEFWVAEADVNEISELLLFSAPDISTIVGRYAPALNLEQALSLRNEASECLVRNTNLSVEIKKEVVDRAWKSLKESLVDLDDGSLTAEELLDLWERRTLVAAATVLPEGMGKELREEIFTVALKEGRGRYLWKSNLRDALISTVAYDLSADAEELYQAAAQGGVQSLQGVLTWQGEPEVLESVIEDIAHGWPSGYVSVGDVLDRHPMRPPIAKSTLWILLKSLSSSSINGNKIGKLLSQSEADEEMWRVAIEGCRGRYPGPGSMLEQIVLHRKAGESTFVREELRKNGCSYLLPQLLPVPCPRAYAEIVEDVWRWKPEEALSLLLGFTPPPGTKLSSEMMGDLLARSASAEDRIRLISMFHKVGGADDARNVDAVKSPLR